MRRLDLPRARGFTIIEILIAIVIVSILAALAIPSYRDYVMRSNRTVAKVALQALVTRQESYAVDHKRYAVDFDRLGIAGSADAEIAYVTTDGIISRNPAGALYQFALFGPGSPAAAMSTTCASLAGIPTANAYRVRATPLVAATDTRCGTLCLASTGERGATGGAQDCWTR